MQAVSIGSWEAAMAVEVMRRNGEVSMRGLLNRSESVSPRRERRSHLLVVWRLTPI